MALLQVKNLNELGSNAGFWDNFIWPLCLTVVITIAIFLRKFISSFFSKKETLQSELMPQQDNSIKISDNTNSPVHIGDNVNVINNYTAEKEKEREKDNSKISDFEATAISKIIKQSPPFQKTQIATNYNGIRVKWEVNLKAVHEPIENIARVMTLYKNNYPWVNFSIDLEEYPIFKVAKTDAKFIITGKIIKTNGATYEIDVEKID